MNPETVIRKASVSDAEELAAIGRLSFMQAFADHPKNHPDDMRDYMAEAFSVETVSAEIADPENTYLIASLGGKSAAYAKLRANSREDGIDGLKPLELCRLYALDEFIGKGIGKALMLHCESIARRKGHDTLWLGVWEFNFRAQEFYAKFGFKKCGEHIFQLGSDPQTDWLMQKSL